jgi:Mce-associated membrane protein
MTDSSRGDDPTRRFEKTGSHLDGPAQVEGPEQWSAPPPPPPRPPVVVPPPAIVWVYAPWRRRVLAFLIDGVVALVAGVVFRGAFQTGAAAPVGELIAVIALQWMQSRSGSTVGKAALGMRLLDLRDGTPPMFVTCVCRWLLHFVDAIFLLGFLAPIVTPRKQTFADLIARTIVVQG